MDSDLVNLASARQFPKVFNDGLLQDTFEREGIIKYPLINGPEILEAERLFNFYCKDINVLLKYGFYPSIYIRDKNAKFDIHQKLAAIINPKLAGLLNNYYSITYSFVVKGTGDNSELYFHQDLTLLDEKKNQSLTLWIPLIDSTVENGTLFALKGSHLLNRQPRAETLAHTYIFINHLLLQYMEPFCTAAGEAVFFDQSVIHFSPANRTGNYRVAIAAALTPKTVPLTIYHCPDPAQPQIVEIYEPPPDMFLQYDDFAAQKKEVPPGSRLLKTITNFNLYMLTKENLENFIWRRSSEIALAV